MDGVSVYYAIREIGVTFGDLGDTTGQGQENNGKGKQTEHSSTKVRVPVSDFARVGCAGCLKRLAPERKFDAGRPAPKLGRGMYLRVVSTAS